MENIYFGTQTQQGLQYRTDRLWSLLKSRTEYSCHGRSVGLADATSENLKEQLALAQLLGAGAAEGVDVADVAARKAAIEAAGMMTDQYVEWQGGKQVVEAARAVSGARRLSEDLVVHATDAQTQTEDLKQLDALTQRCEVLLPMASFLRGHDQPTVCLYAKDNDGRVVGASASVMQYHRDHAKGRKAWWGMLSTDPDRRGEGIAMVMGALCILAMHDRFGTANFMTGIREGNGPSEALCGKLGLRPTTNIFLIAIDPVIFGAGRVTK
ncbi:GNAT family N-acetyltransferase [Yoonia sp.]|uniref:GNAT family N-acetyltransferase n=1 Tax=Yoonia sp. TaxID=2212373 RepID=UPI003F6D36C8